MLPNASVPSDRSATATHMYRSALRISFGSDVIYADRQQRTSAMFLYYNLLAPEIHMSFVVLIIIERKIQPVTRL